MTPADLESPASSANRHARNHEPVSMCRPDLTPRMAIEAWKADKERHRARDRALDRRVERALYRISRERVGLTVRSYTHHEHKPQQPTEDREACERRKHRDRQRVYRNGSADNVRTWTDLSMFTPEEKAAHTRAQAAERKRHQRARERQKKHGVLDDIDVDEALRTLDLEE